jgi:hypothetical protein
MTAGITAMNEKCDRRPGANAWRGSTWRFLPAVILAVGATSCGSVKAADLAGAWVVTSASRQWLPISQQKASAKIVLDRNGSFAASEVPEDLLYGPPGASDGLVTGSGTWKLVLREGKQQVQLDFAAIAVGRRGGVPYGTQLDVSKGWSAVSLFYFEGDPDEGRRVEFERK